MGGFDNCKNLLVIRLDNMGDLIMSSPAICELKRFYPGCKVTLLTSAMAEPIIPYISGVDDKVICLVPWMGFSSNIGERSDIAALAHQLRERQFDGCIIFTVCSQSSLPTALLAYLAGIPLRVAYARENPYELLTHWVPDREPFEELNHQIYRDLCLLRAIGIEPQLSVLPTLKLVGEYEVLNSAVIKEVNLSTSYIIVNMDVSEAKRQFDAAIIKKVIAKLLERGERVVFTGRASSDHLDACVSDLTNPTLINVVGKTKMNEMLCLIANARAVITVNTGVAHISCAYNIPTLVLYANTNPQHVPWSAKSDYISFDIPEVIKSRNQIIHQMDKLRSGQMSPKPDEQLILERLFSLLE